MDGFRTLFSPTNKGGEDQPIQRDEYTPELGSPEEILKKATRWKNDWEGFTGDVKKGLSKKQDKSEKYWLGEQFQDANSDVPLQDNLIFEAVETFLPMATAKNPDPVVASGDQELQQRLQKALYIGSERVFTKATMKMAVRHWSIFFFSAVKTYWDPEINDFQQRAIHPRRMIMEKDAYVDPGGNYHGSYIGEKKSAKWSQLIEMFGEDSPHKEKLLDAAEGNEDKDTEYIEWWTTENLFYTTKEIVLGVYEYPHWNGDQETVDEMGQPVTVPGDNQLQKKTIPYTILTVFNFGETPMDVTSLVWQNIPNQDFINKRMKQIDRNADNMNNGLVLSGDHFTKEQAAEAARHKQKGGTLWVPRGDVNKAYRWDSSPALPEQVFAHLQDSRTELRNIFGIQGSTASGISQDQTVRGKILRGQADQSRVGGLISESIERFVATLYIWQVQMMKVYYTDQRKLIFEGSLGSEEVDVSNLLIKGKASITVKEGSMIPRNPLEERNQAVELFQMGVMSPISLYKKLGQANANEMAKEYVVWMMVQGQLLPASALLLPVDQAIEMGNQAMQAQQQAAQQQAEMQQQMQQAQAGEQQQRGQLDAQKVQTDIELKTREHEMKMQREQQKHEIEMQRGQADLSAINTNGVFKHLSAAQKLKQAEEKHAKSLQTLA